MLDAVVILRLVLGRCFPCLLWIVVLVFWYRLLECLRGDVGWSFPGGFVDMLCYNAHS